MRDATARVEDQLPMTTSTRHRLVAAAAELFQQQGLAATGVKEILGKADARFSSLYHHFPGGKDELAAEAIRAAGARYQQDVEVAWDQAADPMASVHAIFDGAAEVLEASGYRDACPIGTVALEVASTNEPLRRATADVFNAWLDAAGSRLAAVGIHDHDVRRLALSIVMLLEGAFMLSRARRDTEPMRAARTAAAELVATALAAH